MENKELKNSLINRVIEFGTKVNKIEEDIYGRSKSGNEDMEQLFKEYQEKKIQLIDEYCTQRKRTYSLHASFGEPTQFVGIEEAQEKKVILINECRAEVLVQTALHNNLKYLFILLWKGKKWKIDNYKIDSYNFGRWRNQIL